MTINKGSFAYLCFIWMFYILLGGAFALSSPAFWLLLAGTILTLFF